MFKFFATDVVDTGGKFATGVVDITCVVDTDGKFASGVLIPMVHLDWVPNVFYTGAWGKMIHEKT